MVEVLIMLPRQSPPTISPSADPLRSWLPTLSASLGTLRQLAGATEHEFLQIGSRMQDLYQQSVNLAQTAQHLVASASGERLASLIEQLREILEEMDNYLSEAQDRSGTSCSTLHSVGGSLQHVGEPLAGVRKMCKHLYILEVSIKIESSYLGEMGSEFINLAMDVKKLSQQIKDKVNAIQNLHSLLTRNITTNSSNIASARNSQNAAAELTRRKTTTSLYELETVNDSFSRLGTVISTISADNSNSISTIVQSMQFHDIYRQQVEHVIEAIEGLLPSLTEAGRNSGTADENGRREIIGRVGDVCELQQAQLQFASTELYTAVTSIVGNLRDIGRKQKQMAMEIYQQTGAMDTSTTSFVDEVSLQMTSLAALLDTCADSNAQIAAIMKEVTGTVGEITAFVADIEAIGHDIILIALNARIKAASTGPEGASLSVLAEEIGQMSAEAVERTNLITGTLADIDTTTRTLAAEVRESDEELNARLTHLKTELSGILTVLDQMGAELVALIAEVKGLVSTLTSDIETITGSIDVHERTRDMANGVLSALKEIFSHARRLQPASAEFKEDLRQMAQRYTMESERRIHESIAGRHGVVMAAEQSPQTREKAASDSEFGDNVDLF